MRLPLILICFLSIGITVGCYIDRFICQPTAAVLAPTPAQHAAAIASGWIPGTDGYYRAIYGPDAF